MSNIPIRFRRGQGLEVRPNLKLQRGLTQATNLDPSVDGVLSKRPGSDAIALTRSNVLNDTIPADELTALWYREDELVLETDREIYSRNRCPVPGDGAWERRGPWTRTRHRVDALGYFGTDQVMNQDIAVIENGPSGHPCTISLYERRDDAAANLGVEARLISSHLEEVLPIDTGGFRPRIRAFGDDEAFAIYVHNSGDLYWSRYDPMSGFSFVSTGDMDVGPFDLGTGAYAPATDSAYAAMARVTGGATIGVRAWFETGMAGLIALPLASITSATDVAVYALPERGDGQAYFLVAAVGSAGGVRWMEAWEVTGDPATGTLLIVNTATPAMFVGQPRACAVSGPDDGSIAHIWIEVDTGATTATPPNRLVYLYTLPLAGGAETLVRSYRRAAIYTQALWLRDQPVCLLSALGPEFDQRSGYFLVAGTSGEIVGRTQVGESEASNTTVAAPYPYYREDRAPKTSLEVVADEVYAAMATSLSLGAPNTLKYGRWLLAKLPNAPGNDRSIAVSAHGGYPRGYDGQDVFEHDWHELPPIVQTTGTGVGALPAGDYRFAVTYEWYSNGLLFQSRAAFSDTVTLAVAGNVQVYTRPLVFTERENVTAVLWRTEDLSGGADAIWYRDGALDGVSPSADTIILLSTYTDDEVIRNREALDTTILEADGVAITDFVHSDGGRLYSRDPERESVIRFSLFGVEGFGRAWNVDLVEETPDGRALTAVADLDGSLVLFSELGLSIMSGDGPDNAGNGGYSPPRALPVAIGCTGQSTIARISAGVVYGSTRGPRLLGRDLYVRELSEAVSKLYDLDGQRVVATVYQPEEDLLHLLDDGAGGGTGATYTLVYSVGTGRWCSVTNHQGIDMAISANGERATLVVDPSAVVRVENREVFRDGSLNYPWLLATPWVHPETQDDLTYQGFTLNQVTLFGSYLGDHDLFISVYTNYDTTTARVVGTIPAAQLAANQAAGVPYLYQLLCGGIECYAALVLINGSFLGENSPALRLEGVDLTWTPSGNGSPVTLPPEQILQLP